MNAFFIITVCLLTTQLFSQGVDSVIQLELKKQSNVADVLFMIASRSPLTVNIELLSPEENDVQIPEEFILLFGQENQTINTLLHQLKSYTPSLTWGIKNELINVCLGADDVNKNPL